MPLQLSQPTSLIILSFDHTVALFLNSVLQWNKVLHIRSLVLLLALSSCSLKFFLFLSLFSPFFLLSLLHILWKWVKFSTKAYRTTSLMHIHFFFHYCPDLIYSYFLDEEGRSYTLSSWDGSLSITFAQKTWEPPENELWSHNQGLHAGITEMRARCQAYLPCSRASVCVF